MDRELIRLLRTDEIECRVGSIAKNGVSILLYKDARVDQKILDEAFGPFGWKRGHSSIDGNLYCSVSVKDPDTGEWISKQDVGTTGAAEKEKSQASDSFKRACFNWGIGRELYSAPFIWIPAAKINIQERNGKFQCYERFSVSAIAYNDAREIRSLSIDNEKGQRVYTLTETRGDTQEKPGGMAPEGTLSRHQMDLFQKELDRTGVTMKDVEKRYKVSNLAEMAPAIYEKVMQALSLTPDKAA